MQHDQAPYHSEAMGAIPLMQQLREDTHTLHTLAEGQVFQRDLMRGCLPQLLFVAYLEQLWLLHDHLDTAIRSVIGAVPALQQVVQPYHYHTPFLRRDLHYFGSDLEHIQPLAATTRLLEQLTTYVALSPITLLGVHYVLEGSKNGGRFQAAQVRQAYDLPARAGTEYLDPYGEQQPELWQQYKVAMNRLALSATAREAVIEGAKATFRGFTALCQNLMAGEMAEEEAWQTVMTANEEGSR